MYEGKSSSSLIEEADSASGTRNGTRHARCFTCCLDTNTDTNTDKNTDTRDTNGYKCREIEPDMLFASLAAQIQIQIQIQTQIQIHIQKQIQTQIQIQIQIQTQIQIQIEKYVQHHLVSRFKHRHILSLRLNQCLFMGLPCTVCDLSDPASRFTMPADANWHCRGTRNEV